MKKDEALHDDKRNAVAPCGLCCAECPIFLDKIAVLAGDLRTEMHRYNIEVITEFLRTTYDTLGMLAEKRCGTMCREGGGESDCPIKICIADKGYQGCWECDDIDKCDKLDFLKAGHGDAHIKNILKIKRKGMDEFLNGNKLWYSKPKE